MNKKIWYLSLITVFCIVGSIIIVGTFSHVVATSEEENQPPTEQNVEVYPALGPKTVEVVLQRVYLDGEISEEIVEEVIWSMEDFWAFYKDWTLIDQNDSQVIFQQEVDDISPLLKINGYFGISPEGVLKIYEGKPNEEKVIHSFFRINTKKLESHQQNELQEGIPVLSSDHYKKVIKNFKKYAIKEF